MATAKNKAQQTKSRHTHIHIQTILTQVQPLAGVINRLTKVPFSLTRCLNYNINAFLITVLSVNHLESLTTESLLFLVVCMNNRTIYKLFQ